MPESYKGMEVKVTSVDKINCKLDGLSLLKEGERQTLAPTIYVNDMYDNYLESGDLQVVLQNAAKKVDEAFGQTSQLQSLDLGEAKDNIIFQLIMSDGELREKQTANYFSDI
ncbi:hypothetical protein E5329_29425, partial [Petralouisia muris]